MAWNVDLTTTAVKYLKKIDRKWQSIIINYLEDEIAILDDPRSRGKALVGDKKGLWRYRIRDYRVICQILDDECVILVLMLGHRKNIYS